MHDVPGSIDGLELMPVQRMDQEATVALLSEPVWESSHLPNAG